MNWDKVLKKLRLTTRSAPNHTMTLDTYISASIQKQLSEALEEGLKPVDIATGGTDEPGRLNVTKPVRVKPFIRLIELHDNMYLVTFSDKNSLKMTWHEITEYMKPKIEIRNIVSIGPPNSDGCVKVTFNDNSYEKWYTGRTCSSCYKPNTFGGE